MPIPWRSTQAKPGQRIRSSVEEKSRFVSASVEKWMDDFTSRALGVDDCASVAKNKH